MTIKLYDLHDSPKKGYKAQLTGEYRIVKKGEWYLSGSIPAAYKAVNDTFIPYNIVRLVKTEGK